MTRIKEVSISIIVVVAILFIGIHYGLYRDKTPVVSSRGNDIVVSCNCSSLAISGNTSSVRNDSNSHSGNNLVVLSGNLSVAERVFLLEDTRILTKRQQHND